MVDHSDGDWPWTDIEGILLRAKETQSLQNTIILLQFIKLICCCCKIFEFIKQAGLGNGRKHPSKGSRKNSISHCSWLLLCLSACLVMTPVSLLSQSVSSFLILSSRFPSQFLPAPSVQIDYSTLRNPPKKN